MKFLITDIGNEDMVLGYPWLATYKPKVSWRNTTLGNDVLPVINQSQPPKAMTSRDVDIYAQCLNPKEKQHIIEELELSSTINNTSTQLAITAQQYKTKATLPREYSQYARLFNEEASHHFPPSCPWDHTINFVKNTPPFLDCKIYLMTREEDVALKEFLTEQLEKGYIRPSMSLYASPFFFIHKNGKLHPFQDYQCGDSLLSEFRDMRNWSDDRVFGYLNILPLYGERKDKDSATTKDMRCKKQSVTNTF